MIFQKGCVASLIVDGEFLRAQVTPNSIVFTVDVYAGLRGASLGVD